MILHLTSNEEEHTDKYALRKLICELCNCIVLITPQITPLTKFGKDIVLRFNYIWRHIFAINIINYYYYIKPNY